VKRIGLVGARGYVGAELIRLLAAHPDFELAYVASRERAGQGVAAFHPEVDAALAYADATPDSVVAASLDAVVLALPNGASATYVEAIDATEPGVVVVDLSADHRFDPTWAYGLPELDRRATGCPRARRRPTPG
jgi:N-acetyl-gamma-glutamylphosphate reductase